VGNRKITRKKGGSARVSGGVTWGGGAEVNSPESARKYGPKNNHPRGERVRKEEKCSSEKEDAQATIAAVEKKRLMGVH